MREIQDDCFINDWQVNMQKALREWCNGKREGKKSSSRINSVNSNSSSAGTGLLIHKQKHIYPGRMDDCVCSPVACITPNLEGRWREGGQRAATCLCLFSALGVYSTDHRPLELLLFVVVRVDGCTGWMQTDRPFPFRCEVIIIS